MHQRDGPQARTVNAKSTDMSIDIATFAGAPGLVGIKLT